MKKFLILAGFCAMAFAGTMLCSCSDDNEGTDDGDNKKYERLDHFDELGIIQNNLVRLNEKGEVDEYILGIPLDAADSTELTVGVESYNEAVQIFDNIFPDTTVISMDGTHATLTVDEGSATLTPTDGTDGVLAISKFSIPGLKHVSKLRFIKNSAWPENATTVKLHSKGVFYEGTGWTSDDYYSSRFKKDDTFDYLCLKEYSNGQPGILCALTTDKLELDYSYFEQYGGNMPSMKIAREISEILRGNWDYYVAKYNGALVKDAEYWVGEGSSYWIMRFHDCIYLSSGKEDYFENDNVGHHKARTMFYMKAGVKKASLD